MSPLTPIAHLLAIAVGAWGGLTLMGNVTPDLPPPDEQPGVEATAPHQVSGGDADSLFRAGPFANALAQLDDQIASGDRVVTLELTPGALHARSGRGGLDLAPDEIEPNAPERIVAVINGERSTVTLDDVQAMELVPTRRGPRWFVQLSPDVDPPRAYVATLDGASVEPGPAPPRS